MKFVFTLTLSWALFANTLLAKETLRLAPLPMKSPSKLIKSFSPFVRYLEKELNVTVELIYHKHYNSLLKAFKEGDIDIAYLGPLPFISLHQDYKDAIPLVKFNEKNGENGYRCVLAKFALDKLPPNSLKNQSIALTQPQSTCGYFMGKQLLAKHFDTDIQTMKFDYRLTHTEVANSVVRGEYLLGSLKESMAKRHASLGLEIIAKSTLLPGFSLIANQATLSKMHIRQIQTLLIKTPESIYKTWGDQLSHGMNAVTMEDYRSIIDTLSKSSVIPQKRNF